MKKREKKDVSKKMSQVLTTTWIWRIGETGCRADHELEEGVLAWSLGQELIWRAWKKSTGTVSLKSKLTCKQMCPTCRIH